MRSADNPFVQQRKRAALTADVLKKNMDFLYLQQVEQGQEIVSLQAHIDRLDRKIAELEVSCRTSN